VTLGPSLRVSRLTSPVLECGSQPPRSAIANLHVRQRCHCCQGFNIHCLGRTRELLVDQLNCRDLVLHDSWMPVEEIETRVVEVHVHGGVEEYDTVSCIAKGSQTPYPFIRYCGLRWCSMRFVSWSFRENERILKGLV
jgi:hypothetical protein